MRYLAWLLILLAYLINVPLTFGDETSKRAKIEVIVEMWRLDEELENYHDSCTAGYNKGDPEILVKDNPEYFYGIHPGSPDWNSIMTSWNKYVQTSCGFMNAQKYRDTVNNTLSSQLTEINTDEILRFYRSKSGQAYLNAQKVVSEKMQNYYRQTATVAGKAAFDTYASEVKIVTDNYVKKQHEGILTAKSHLFDSIAGIGGIIGGLLLVLAPRTSKSKYPGWVNKAFIIAGSAAIVWGMLVLYRFYRYSVLDQRIFAVIDHYKTFLGGFWLGLIVILLLAGQFKRSRPT